MAEFLVKAVDHKHPDFLKDKAGAYKRGMIVEVRENGAKYGRAEGPPKFIVIKVPHLPVAMVKYLQEPRMGDVYRGGQWVGLTWVDGYWDKDMIRRRHFILDLTGLAHGQALSPAEFFGRLRDAN